MSVEMTTGDNGTGERTCAPAVRDDVRSPTDQGMPAHPRSQYGPLVGIKALARGIREGNDADVQREVLAVSRSRRWLAPLAFVVGAVAMLFVGLRLIVTNWRLTLIEVLPAMWIWLAMLDLKAHALRGQTFHQLEGLVLIPLFLVVMGLTAAMFFLNAVFAFAIAGPGKPQIGPAFGEARRHLRVVSVWGFGVGLALAFSALVVIRWGRPWFAISLGAVVGVMMLTYVAVPARIVGIKARAEFSNRDKLVASAMGGAIGALVCAPPYVIGRVGLLLLGSRTLFVLGVVLMTLAATLQAAATGAVRAVKMSSKLATGQDLDVHQVPPRGANSEETSSNSSAAEGDRSPARLRGPEGRDDHQQRRSRKCRARRIAYEFHREESQGCADGSDRLPRCRPSASKWRLSSALSVVEGPPSGRRQEFGESASFPDHPISCRDVERSTSRLVTVNQATPAVRLWRADWESQGLAAILRTARSRRDAKAAKSAHAPLKWPSNRRFSEFHVYVEDLLTFPISEALCSGRTPRDTEAL